MPQAGSHDVRTTWWSLNSDGRAHPRENVLAVVTLVLGIVAVITGLMAGTHVIGSWTGLAGLAVGLYSQMISATTPERSLNIIGIVGSFVGLWVGVANGGFLPG